MSRIFIAVLVVVLVFVGYIAWQKHQGNIAFGNGDVTVRDGSATDNSRMATGSTDIDGKPVGQQTASSSIDQGVGSGKATNQPLNNQNTATLQTASAGSPATVPPAGDSLARNSPNGVGFGGSGRYQWYRQGDLTWRIDTGSGAMCVAFATMPEWRKPNVYSHGCGNS